MRSLVITVKVDPTEIKDDEFSYEFDARGCTPQELEAALTKLFNPTIATNIQETWDAAHKERVRSFLKAISTDKCGVEEVTNL